MKHNIILIFFCFYALTFYCQINICPVLPSPVVYKKGNGSIMIPKEISIYQKNKSDFPVSKLELEQINLLLKNSHEISLKEVDKNPLIVLQKSLNVPRDFYSININEHIIISYSNERSLFYAFQSLNQLIQTKDDINFIDKAFLQDYPKFEWRGLHLDVSRHFFTVNEVKKYIDLMARYKFNTFHWHLTDDQGWRIEIKAFPKLTSIGAWRDSTIKNHFSTSPRTFDSKPYGGFYTQDEIKEVVSYASDRFISVVPEIEMPGHSRAALAAYPEYSCSGSENSVPGVWGVFDDIYCSKEETFSFIENILDEVLELFPGKYIHIGGDEAPKTRWKKCQECQGVITSNQLKDEQELQSYFIKRIEKYLLGKDRKLIGWDEILEGGLSTESTVMSWRGTKGGIEACRQGNYVVMSPGSHCYFDHYQGKSSDEPLAIGGYTPLEKVYEFNPIPDVLNVAEASYILGGQANLWTEYISSMKQLEYMTYPRAIALSQVLWCSNKPNFETFFKILSNSHFNALKKLNVNYSKTSLKPVIQIRPENKGIGIELQSKDENEQFETIVHSQDRKSALNFSLKANQLLVIERTKNKRIESNYRFKSKKTGINTQLEISKHMALGCPIQYKTLPNEQYNYSPNLILDGQYGKRPWRGHQWIGFDTSSIVFEVDLQKKKRIRQIELSFLESNGSWIYLPKQITISMSKRKRNYQFTVNQIRSEKVKLDIGRRTRKISFKIDSEIIIPIGKPGAGHKP